jgi:16S rRNA (uracil1498-N3)-methyltransferase
MHLFYCPDITTTLELTEEESGHAVRVLRLAEGAEIIVIDGAGTFHRALITRAHPKRCGVEIVESWTEEKAWPVRIHVAVAPTKNLDRIEWFVEKATEIGIDDITLLKCRYSERKEVKLERLQKIVVSATKQSLKATLPRLEGMVDFKRLVEQPFDGQKFIAHCYREEERKLYAREYKPGSNVLVLIGPEGDFSEEEVALALANGFVPVTLGNSRLRTETAALVACHTAHVVNQIG